MSVLENVGIGLASFGTGVMQGYNQAMQQRLDEQAEKRMLAYRKEIDERIRKDREADQRQRVRNALFPLQTRPTPPGNPQEVAPKQAIEQRWQQQIEQELTPMIEANVSAGQLAQIRERRMDEFRKEAEQQFMSYMAVAGEAMADGNVRDGVAALIEGNKYNLNGYAMLPNIETGNVDMVDEDSRQVIKSVPMTDAGELMEMAWVPAKERRQEARAARREKRQEAQHKASMALSRERLALSKEDKRNRQFARDRDDTLDRLTASAETDEIATGELPNMTLLSDLANQSAISKSMIKPGNRRAKEAVDLLVSDIAKKKDKLSMDDFEGPRRTADGNLQIRYKKGPWIPVTPDLAQTLQAIFQRQASS